MLDAYHTGRADHRVLLFFLDLLIFASRLTLFSFLDGRWRYSGRGRLRLRRAVRAASVRRRAVGVASRHVRREARRAERDGVGGAAAAAVPGGAGGGGAGGWGGAGWGGAGQGGVDRAGWGRSGVGQGGAGQDVVGQGRVQQGRLWGGLHNANMPDVLLNCCARTLCIVLSV